LLKRILVTGGSGFLGSHLCEKLLDSGNDVLSVDNYFTGRKENIAHLIGNPYFETMRHDITFPLYIEVDEVYNLACPASPIHYQFDPVQTTKTSVHGVTETGYPQSGGEEVTSRRYMKWPGTQQGQLQFMVDLVNTVRRAPNGLGIFYWAPEARGRGNGLWNSDGSPAPAIFVLDNLTKLTARPPSHSPDPLPN